MTAAASLNLDEILNLRRHHTSPPHAMFSGSGTLTGSLAHSYQIEMPTPLVRPGLREIDLAPPPLEQMLWQRDVDQLALQVSSSRSTCDVISETW